MKRIVKAAVLAANATGLFSRVQIPVATGRSFSKSQSLNQMSGPVWNLGRLNHVAIAVPDLGKASSFYRDVLGAQVSEAVPLPEHGVSVVFVDLGNTKLELLHPLGSDSPISGFLQKKKAGGMHHLCIEEGKSASAPDSHRHIQLREEVKEGIIQPRFTLMTFRELSEDQLLVCRIAKALSKVDDIETAVKDLKKKKIHSLTDETKIGAHGKPVIFLHPKDCGGVLVELEQA